jgi:hypothetical protein
MKMKIYRNIILRVFYGCETWSLTLKEERRLGVFENRVLRRIFGSKRDEVTGAGNCVVQEIMWCREVCGAGNYVVQETVR